MNGTATNARIIFADGGLVLPAQTAYDRQQLIEHVQACTRSKEQVRVRLDHTTWFVERPDAQLRLSCHSCTQPIRRAMCRRSRAGMVYCLTCALARPHLTVAFLSELPVGTTLRDVQAHYAYGGEWVAWTRWPQATPAEIIDDIHLQRRFAPVLTWRCAEISLPRPARVRREIPHRATVTRVLARAR